MNTILLLDKPKGLSSNAALQRVRRLLRADKAGHVGSLDPLATGMLPICLGEATKIATDIVSGRKRYRFTIGLGTRTATGDTEGAVVETAPVPALTREAVETVLRRFMGRQSQIPPMYSALKRDGQPLYKLARAGVEVERSPREIQVFELPLVALDIASIELEALCSKGTYVRTLAEDVAKAVGTCGHVTELRRLYVEPFDREAMETLESVASRVEAGLLPRMLPADWPLQHVPAVSLTAVQASRIQHGQAVSTPTSRGAPATAPFRVRLYDEGGRFLGMGECDAQGNVRPRRLFVFSDER